MLGHRSKVIRPFGDLLQACWGPPSGLLGAYGSFFFLAFFPTIITIEPRCLGAWIGFLARRFKSKWPNLDQPLSERVGPIVPKQSTHTAKFACTHLTIKIAIKLSVLGCGLIYTYFFFRLNKPHKQWTTQDTLLIYYPMISPVIHNLIPAKQHSGSRVRCYQVIH